MFQHTLHSHFGFQPCKQQIFIVNEWMVLLFNGKNIVAISASQACFVIHESLSQDSLSSISVMIQTPLIQPHTHTPKSWWLGIIIIHHHITPGDASANFWASSVFWIAYFLFKNEVLIELWRCKTKALHLKGFAGERSVWKQRYESLCVFLWVHRHCVPMMSAVLCTDVWLSSLP